MITKEELEQVRKEHEPVFFLAVIFIVLFLLTICSLGVRFLIQLTETSPTPTPVLPLIVPPTNIPAPMPVKSYSTHLPIILSSSVVLSSSMVNQVIWIVTKVKNLGYELNGQRYDLATFKRINSQDTAKAYCINRGWDTPDVGAEYILSAEGIFIPLSESEANPLQRFLKIK